MKKTLTTLMAAGLLTGLFASATVLAEDHKAEATQHALAAAASGKKGDAVAATHLKAAEKAF